MAIFPYSRTCRARVVTVRDEPGKGAEGGRLERKPSGISVRELERQETDIQADSAAAQSARRSASRVRLIETIAELRECVAHARERRESIALVPTMGAFHEGHLSLMRRARADCDFVVVSLFVNPSQFGAAEDLEGYPRDRGRDAALAREEEVDVLFAPSFEQVYPDGFSTAVEVAGLGETLCGDRERRGPGHFRGVATVVTKLLNICEPDVAYFGAKDYQQTVVIRRLVADLDIPVRIEVCPTVRDRDGLALSSRNAYLSEEERRRALSLKRALDAAAAAIAAGETDAATVVEVARRQLAVPGVEPDYVEVVSARDLTSLDRLEGEILIAVAARVGRARLIDNIVVNVGPVRVAKAAAAGLTSG
jgi:pantoate--beta-alanine ligase